MSLLRLRFALLPLLLAAWIGLPATSHGKERELDDAIDLVIQEIAIREAAIGADVVTNTKEARLLRRGRESLEQAIAHHANGKWRPAAQAFAKGLGKLDKAFGPVSDGAGMAALSGVHEELEQDATARLSALTVQVDQLPASEPVDQARKNIDRATRRLDVAARAATVRLRVVALLGAYLSIGKAEKKIGKARELTKEIIQKAIGKLIPKDLTPFREYSVRWTVNGTLSTAGYRTREHPSKLTWQILRNQIRHLSMVFGPDEDCPFEISGTPWNGTALQTLITYTCATGAIHTVRCDVTLLPVE